MYISKEIFVFLCLCVFSSMQICSQFLESNFSQENCTTKSVESSGESYYYEINDLNGIPKCKKYSDNIHKDCSTDSKCMPGYFCDKRCGPDDNLKQMKCNEDYDCPDGENNVTVKCGSYCMAEGTASCMAYHINTSDYNTTYWTAEKFKPLCNNKGEWQAKQCKGGVNGRCMCFDANGNRIFGEANYQDSENMTCACSSRKAELASSSQLNSISLHCDSMGNYEPLQCDMTSKQCWCVQPETGELTSTVVPESVVKFLPCYTNQEQYLRQCESKRIAQTLNGLKLSMHGVHVTADLILCDDDGSFGRYSREKNNLYCTWRNNSKIESYQTDIGSVDITNLNCNCARDSLLYDITQACTYFGNYKPLQQETQDNYYCVDQDGFAKSGFLTDIDDGNLSDEICDKFYYFDFFSIVFSL